MIGKDDCWRSVAADPSGTISSRRMASRILNTSRGALRLLSLVLLAVMTGQAAPPVSTKTELYAALGTDITQYDLDTKTATLTKHATVTLPANVQEAWVSPNRKFLYVAWSNGGASYASAPTPPKGDHHGITAFRIDPQTGALLPHGQPASLPSRPIFTTTDLDGTHIITAHNDPSSLTVHRILPDGTLGPQIAQPAGLDFGIYGHQVRMDPSGQTVILVTRGNGPTATRPEDPGALKLFSFKDGILANRLSIAPGGGFGYQVRHVDFHPSGNWTFATLERQNQLHVYERKPDGSLSAMPLFVRSTLMPSTKSLPSQTAASIHVHPDGRYAYVANRATDTSGENTIAVFSINPETGEPILIQSIDTHGFTPRTFSLDPGGSVLAVANQSPMTVRDGKSVKMVPASLALFHIGKDGKLTFSRKYDVETTPDRNLFWTGIMRLQP